MDFGASIKLESKNVVLRPFSPADAEDLQPAALDEDIWKWMLVKISNAEELPQ